MRLLNEEETKIFFGKLSLYIGANIKFLIDRQDEPYVFMTLESTVYYMSDRLAKLAASIGRDELLHVGTCFGKFTKTKKFRLHITCLDYLAKYAKHKVWLKPGGEQSYLYGNHIIKTQVAKVSENIPQYGNIIFYSLNETPIGFGVAAKSTTNWSDHDLTSVVFFNQADLGEYLRVEDQEEK